MNSRKNVMAILTGCMLYAGLYAQEAPQNPPPPKPPKEKGMEEKREMVQAMKTGFLTKEMDLSPEEAQKFWPVYNMYEKELKELQKVHRDKMQAAKTNIDQMNDKEVEVLVDNFIMQEQKELDLKKKYHGEFKKVLPIRKVGKLYHAEEKFKKELLGKMKDQNPPMPPHPKPQMPDQEPKE